MFQIDQKHETNVYIFEIKRYIEIRNTSKEISFNFLLSMLEKGDIHNLYTDKKITNSLTDIYRVLNTQIINADVILIKYLFNNKFVDLNILLNYLNTYISNKNLVKWGNDDVKIFSNYLQSNPIDWEYYKNYYKLEI